MDPGNFMKTYWDAVLYTVGAIFVVFLSFGVLQYLYIWLPFPSASCSQVLCNFSMAVDKYFSLGYFPYVSSPFFHLISTKKLSWLILHVCTCVHVHKRACWYFILPYFCLLWCDEHLNLVFVPAGYRFLSYNLTEMNKAGLFKFNHRYMVFQTRYCK